MKDYYKIFGLQKNKSRWYLVRKLEARIRTSIENAYENADGITALRIFLSEDAKKIYDLNLSTTPRQLRSWAFIKKYIDKTPDVVAMLDMKSAISEKQFLSAHWELILNRTFGFDLVLDGLGKRSNSGELEYARRTSVAAMQVYFYFYFGIPLLLGYHVNEWFYLLAVPLILIKVNKEYKRVKIAYYQSMLDVNVIE